MIEFKKTPSPDNHFDRTEIIFRTEAEKLTDILEDFKDFLLGCGYVISPHSSIEIVKDE